MRSIAITVGIIGAALVVSGCSDFGLGQLVRAQKRREAQCHPVVTRTFADPMATLRAEQRARPYPIRVIASSEFADGTHEIEWVMDHAGHRLRGVQVHRPHPAGGGYQLCRAAENNEAAYACAVRVCTRPYAPSAAVLRHTAPPSAPPDRR